MNGKLISFLGNKKQGGTNLNNSIDEYAEDGFDNEDEKNLR